MKKFAFALVCSLLMVAPGYAQEKKRESPAKTTEQSVGEVDVKIEYSSPFVKERDIYGGLVPWNKIWRAGANEATTIDFSKDVMIDGQELAAGKYAFFVIPKEDGEWTLIFNSEAKQWGAYKYDESKDALRIEAEAEEIENTESLTYSIDEDGTVALDWASSRVTFVVE